MDTNYHTHTMRCKHAKGTVREYVESAIENGFKVLGFSDHTPYPFPDACYETSRCMDLRELENYVDDIIRVQKEYCRDIQIHLGLEVEYYPLFFNELLKITSDYPIEYFLLGQHKVGNGEIKEPFCYRNITEDAGYLRQYCDQVIAGIDTGCFTYLAHPDLPSFVGAAAEYDAQMHRLCRHAKQMGLPIEINFVGLRGNLRYPNEAFWEIAGEEGCDVILGVDAHDPIHFCLGDTLIKAMELVRRYRLKVIDNVTLKDPFVR